MAERATAHESLATGAKVLGIYGSGRFFDGVDEVEPTLILHIDLLWQLLLEIYHIMQILLLLLLVINVFKLFLQKFF